MRRWKRQSTISLTINLMTLNELKEGVKRLKVELSALISGDIKCAAVKTDKAVLVHNADELEVGIDVFVEDEEGTRIPAPDGEYVTEERTKIVVADGKVKEITEIEENGESETETAETEVKAEEASPYLTREEAKEIYKEINELYKLVDGLMKKVGTDRDALDARLATVEKMSAGQHPAESFKENITHPSSTGDKSVDAKLARFSAMFKK